MKKVLVLFCLLVALFITYTAYAQDVSELFRWGYYAYLKHDYDQAHELLEKAVERAPQYIIAHYWLGRTYEKLGKNEEAIEEFEIVLELQPDYEDTAKRIDKLLSSKEVAVAPPKVEEERVVMEERPPLEVKELKEEERVVEEVPLAYGIAPDVSSITPEFIQEELDRGGSLSEPLFAKYREGLELMAGGDMDNAAKRFGEVVIGDRNFAEAYYLRGLTYWFRRDSGKGTKRYYLNQAKIWLSKALARDPSHVEAQRMLLVIQADEEKIPLEPIIAPKEEREEVSVAVFKIKPEELPSLEVTPKIEEERPRPEITRPRITPTIPKITGERIEAPAEIVKLEYKYNEGDMSRYKLDVGMDINLEGLEELLGGLFPAEAQAGLGGEASQLPETINMNLNMVMRQEILDVTEAGVVTMRQTVERMMVDLMGEIQSLDEVTGEPITVKIDKDGRVLSVSGLEDLEQQIGQSIEMTQGLQQQFQALLPSQEVDIGSSWTTEQSQEIPDFGEMKFQTKYTLAGFERVKGYDCARIDLNMTGSVIGKGTGGAGAAEEMAGLPFEDMSMDLSGNLSGDGVVYFAPDEGKLIGTYSDMDIDFRLKMDLKMDTSAMQESMEGMEGMEDMFKGMMQDSFEMDLKLKMKMAVNMELL